MKRSVRILAMALVVVMLCVSLAACGKILMGEYVADMGLGKIKMDFKFNTVEITVEAFGESATAEAEYEIKDDKITFSMTDEAEDELGMDFGGDAKFEKTDDGIKIDGVEFKKQ